MSSRRLSTTRPFRYVLVAGAVTAAAMSLAADAPLPDPLEAGWKGEKVCEVLHEDDRQRVLRCTFPPGAGHERHYHAPHFGYTLSDGRMEITDAGGTRVVESSAGATWTSEGVDWHEVVNIGDTTTQYLIVEVRDR